MYTTCYVKNIDSIDHTWAGQLLTPGQEYLIEDHERMKWANNDSVVLAITADQLQVGNGTSYITGYSDQIDRLKSRVITVSNLVSKGTLNLPEVAVHKPEGNSYAYTSHDFCDKCSWFGDSVRVEGEELSLDSGLTYSSAHTYWVDLSHGRVYQEDNYASSYLPVIYDGATPLVEDVDYTINYEEGTVTLQSAPSGTVTADYSYATTSTFYVRTPSAGLVKFIEHTELQVTANVVITDEIHFEAWAYNPYDPPNKVCVETIKYKNGKDYINGANLGQGFIPSFGGSALGLSSNIIVFPFNYASMTPLCAHTGVEIRIRLKNDIPFTASDSNSLFGTVTFYILEEADTH